MADTAIEWTDTTWNPTTGCDRVSPGCDNCYALTMAKRLKGMGSAKYQTDGDPRTSGPGFGIAWHPDTLTEPLRWKKPRKVFVNSMSDLFHTKVPDEFLAAVFAVMAVTPRHTYQVLTKRHGRMRSLLNSPLFEETVLRNVLEFPGGAQAIDEQRTPWPLPNVWLGVSVEDQQRADLRIPALLDTPAAVRFLSCEPLLGPVDLSSWMQCPDGTHRIPLDWINWVIVGGESGPGVYVGRPTKWGNPYKAGGTFEHMTGGKSWPVHDHRHAVELYKQLLDRTPNLVTEIRDELKGTDLACWCPPGQPCHADLLLKLANERPAPPPLEARCPDCSICGKETDYSDEQFVCEQCECYWPADNRAYDDRGEWNDPEAKQCAERVQPWLDNTWVTDPEHKREVVRCLLDASHTEHDVPHGNPEMTALVKGWN